MNLDYLTIVLVIIIISLIYYLSSRFLYNHYLKKPNQGNFDGREVSNQIISGEGMLLTLARGHRIYQNYVDVPRKTLILSSEVIDKSSITALAVVSYEITSSIMTLKNNILWVIKELINLIILVSASIGTILILLSLILNEIYIYNLGISIFFIAIAFVLITIPIGIYSAIKSLKLLKKYSLIFDKDKSVVTIFLIFLSHASLNLLVSLMVILIDYILDSLKLK